MIRLVLASASPARLATLRSAGVEPEVVPSGVDEDALLAAAVEERGRLTPAESALLLARAKAEAVRGPGALVLGCDSVLELDGETYGKPTNASDAVARWRSMRGRAGVLHTGHWLVDHRSGAITGSTGAVVGLSLPLLRTLIRELSMAWHELWTLPVEKGSLER